MLMIYYFGNGLFKRFILFYFLLVGLPTNTTGHTSGTKAY